MIYTKRNIILLGLLLVVAIFLSYCRRKPSTPEFEKYVTKFEQEFNIDTFGIPVHFKEMEGTEVGVCYYFHIKYWRSIGIKKEYWESVSDVDREILMYHELGHCVMGLEHDDTLFDVGPFNINNSLMNSYTIPDVFYINFRQHYIDDLRKKYEDRRR
jgi:Putative phage metallopeptidase